MLKLLSIVLLVLVSTLFSLRVLSLNAKAWQCLNDEPEMDDFPETPYLLSRSNTAIGFSGGGNTDENDNSDVCVLRDYFNYMNNGLVAD